MKDYGMREKLLISQNLIQNSKRIIEKSLIDKKQLKHL
jgi:hypothetical protein